MFWFGVYPGGGCSKTNISGGDKQTDRYFLVNLPLLNLGLQYQNVGIVIGPWLTFSRISKTTFANFNLFSAEFRYYF